MSKISLLCSQRHTDRQYETVRAWSLAWSHDGRLLATCGDDHAVRLWTRLPIAPYLESVATLDESHARAVRSVNFSHCGRYLASASFDAAVVVYEKDKSGEFGEVSKLEGHENEVKCCAFSPSDEFLATCSRDKSVWFWQMDEDEDFQVSSILQPHTQDVKFVCWHPKEELLVSCSYDYAIRFYKYDGEDWITQQKIDNAHEGTVWCAAFDAEGMRLITVGEDHVIQLWRRCDATKSAVADEWRSVAKYTVDDTRWPLYSVSWNALSGLVAVAGGDATVRLFRVESDPSGMDTIVPLNVIEDHHEGQEVNCVAWHPTEANLLATCGDDGMIRLFSVEL